MVSVMYRSLILSFPLLSKPLHRLHNRPLSTWKLTNVNESWRHNHRDFQYNQLAWCAKTMSCYHELVLVYLRISFSLNWDTSVNSQHPPSILLASLSLLLVAFRECWCWLMITSNVVQWFHFVDPDDPVLTRESFLQCAELRTLIR